ncbi:unnamed protein product [Clavelina lepadiformis]|uniref:Uncharacterized protein n=1 Tax=Clavelina lepadiformis TaxID=159417 RepID=A0ABP0FDH5_CLALP
MKVAADRGCSGIGRSIPNLLMLEHTQGCNPSNRGDKMIHQHRSIHLLYIKIFPDNSTT